ncbi:MAG: toll/interleukin-1 receptor domain-containing protein [Steroidobacteraceae bacterium]
MSHVFISYSQPDTECAHEIVARLEAESVRCWIAPRDIAPAADWAAEIIDAISAARTMVLVFSASSNQSPQVRREVERAVHKQVDILPFRIEDVMPSKSLEFFLSAQHWMDAFPSPREPHYQRLCGYLKTSMGTPRSHTTADAGERAGSPGTGGQGLSATELRHIEAHLAGYIGPLAKHLVKRAALRTNDWEGLVAGLAAELDAESDRRAFIERCRLGRV